MGGFGSGRWYRSNTATPVEDCLVLDVNRLSRGRALGPYAAGTITWPRFGSEKPRGTVEFQVQPSGQDGRILVLRYRFAKSEDIELPIRLQTTRPHLGGLRWWMTCPLVSGGVACKRRVGKLYLPPLARYFGCPRCFDLTYRSCQESHQWERSLRTVDRLLRELDRGA